MPSPDKYAHLAAEGFAGNRHLLLALTFSVAVYGPLLGALIATGHERGSHGVRDLLARTFNPRVAPRWYLVALIIAAALSLVPTLLVWTRRSLVVAGQQGSVSAGRCGFNHFDSAGSASSRTATAAPVSCSTALGPLSARPVLRSASTTT